MARAELDVARAHGIPRSIFLGRPWPSPGEPLWLDEDREWALAAHFNDLDTCGGCGQPLSESRDPANEYGYTTEPMRCHACASMARTSRKFLDGGTGAVADGLTFHVHHD